MKIKVEVFSTNCARCKRLELLVNSAVVEAGVDAEVVKVTDVNAMEQRGIRSVPGIAINGEVKFPGRMPSLQELLAAIKDAAEPSRDMPPYHG
jgi:small redox-active disulfide protein 2